MRILLIEDEKKISDFIKKGLKEEGYAVDTSYDGENGYFLSSTNEYDLIIVDIMIPKLDGINFCKKLREEKNFTPIIILTAKNSIEYKVLGLDSGANDYITKPFAFEEFLARIRALLRKGENYSLTKLSIYDLELNLLNHEVYRGGQKIDLTIKEYSLLEYFLRNKEKVITRTMICEHVWGNDFDSNTNIIDVYINFLRKKINLENSKKLIDTIRGRGYIIR